MEILVKPLKNVLITNKFLYTAIPNYLKTQYRFAEGKYTTKAIS